MLLSNENLAVLAGEWREELAVPGWGKPPVVLLPLQLLVLLPMGTFPPPPALEMLPAPQNFVRFCLALGGRAGRT